MIRAIAFDLDDTLYPEDQFVYSGYRAVSDDVKEKWGVEIYDELVSLFAEGQRGDLFTPVLQRHLEKVNEASIQPLVKIYRQHKPTISPFPETKVVIANLKDSYVLALISDGYLGVQKRKLDALQLRHFFDVIIFSDQWGRRFWKPHQRPYRECAYQLGLDFSAMVYVADNPAKDFVTARQLGMKTIRVKRKGTLHQKVLLSDKFEADHKIASLAELPILLEQMDQ